MTENTTRPTALPTPHSQLAGRIDELTQLQKSLLFAELSSVSYYDAGEARTLTASMGFSGLQFFDRDGAQAYMFWNDHDCVVACRGTEPHEWNDIKADANAVSVLTETFGPGAQRLQPGSRRPVAHAGKRTRGK